MKIHSPLLAALAAGASLAPLPAAVLAAEGGFTLEEITVTARRTEESLQDTPVAITAVSGTELATRNEMQIDAISRFVPNVNFSYGGTSSGSSSAAVVFIRGVGQNDFLPSTEPGVGLYVDGIYYGRSLGSAIELLDLERVEVLRGPQGTLFGRNTIGGAINVISRQPGDTYAATLRGTVGANQRRDLQTSLDLPLAADFKVGASLLSRKRDGYVQRLDGVELGVDDTLGARITAVWTPSATLQAMLTLDGTREREESAPEVLLNAIEAGQFPGFFNNNTFGNGSTDATCSDGGDPNNRACYNNSWVLGPFLSGSGGPSRNDVDSRGASLVVDWQPNDTLAFKSLTARRSLDANFARDPDGSPYDLFSSQDLATQKQFSQEFQLIATPSDRLSLVSGAYYFREDAMDNTYITFLPPTSPLLIGGHIENRNHALFGEATYSVSPRLRLIGGVRYTEERKAYIGTSLRGNGGVPSVSILTGAAAGEQVLRDERTTWRASLSYDISTTMTGYATVSTGFKSGGFTTRITDPNTTIPRFGPESVRLVELGLKTELPLAGLRLNTAVFHSDYDDIQLDGVVPGAFGTMTFNGGDAVLRGVEMELDWVATESLRLSGTLGYLDAHYTRINTGSLVSLRDDLIRAPRWTAAVGASYRLAIGSGSLTPRLDIAYKSETQFEPVNTPFTRDNGYTALNLNVPYQPAQGNWRLSFGIENLTDAHYLIAADSNTAIGYDVGAFARPRNWSLGLEAWF